MDTAQLNGLANFIWNIADDVLRDVFVRGKYRDVILPMTVLRRLDAVLEPTKQAVLNMKAALDKEGVTNQDDALRAASGQAFYNTSPFLLRDLKSRATEQKLKDDFEAYLDGFAPNVQDILTNFEFRNQIPRLTVARKDVEHDVGGVDAVSDRFWASATSMRVCCSISYSSAAYTSRSTTSMRPTDSTRLEVAVSGASAR